MKFPKCGLEQQEVALFKRAGVTRGDGRCGGLLSDTPGRCACKSALWKYPRGPAFPGPLSDPPHLRASALQMNDGMCAGELPF